MSKVQMYPEYARRPLMFKGVKKITLPNQCMSLAEMLRRFVRREALPAERQGVYVESDYDLEKVAKMDRVDQEEVLEVMKADTLSKKSKKEAEEKRIADDIAKRDQEAADATEKRMAEKFGGSKGSTPPLPV